MNARFLSEQIWAAGIESVLPAGLIRNLVSVSKAELHVSGQCFHLDKIDSIYVIGAGKASALMAVELENILGDRITMGHVVVKYGHSIATGIVRVSEAGHPIPDMNGVTATKEILRIALEATGSDLVIFLLSGGGSSLLVDCPGDIRLQDLASLNALLLSSGAGIYEINAVRKHLSQLKGGQLSRIVYPAKLVSLILSDVVGAPPDVIASGPSVPDPTTFSDALEVLNRYDLIAKIPDSIRNHLSRGLAGLYPETPNAGSPYFANTFNFIIGNNRIALEAAMKKATELGFDSRIITNSMEGNTLAVADRIIDTAFSVQKDESIRKPACLLFGGETTIKVEGKGLGGRNQHLALYAAIKLRDRKGITILSAGTDGNDGPTDAAGAVVDSSTGEIAATLNLDIEKHLEEFDSYHFFKKAGGHVVSGPTMTNVMDLIVVLIE